MAFDPKNIEAVTVSELPNLPMSIGSILTHGVGDILAGGTIPQLVAVLTPLLSAIGGSGFVSVPGTVLPNNTGVSSQFTVVGQNTYTQTTGGSIQATGVLNVLGWNGTTWALIQSVPKGSLVQKDEITRLLNLDFSDFATKVTAFAPSDKTGGTFAGNFMSNANTYFDGTVVSVGENLTDIYVISAVAGAATLKFITISGTAATIVHTATVNLAVGKNAFNAASLNLPTALANTQYYVGIQPSGNAQIRTGTTGGNLGIIPNTNVVTYAAPYSAPLWLLKQTAQSSGTQFVLSTYPEVRADVQEMVTMSTGERPIPFPADMSAGNYATALTIGQSYGVDNVYFDPAKFQSIKIKVQGTTGSIEIRFRTLEAGVFTTRHTFTKSVTSSDLLDGVLTIPVSELGLPNLSAYDKVYPFFANTVGSLIRFNTGGDPKTFWVLNTTDNTLTTYAGAPLATFSFWVVSLGQRTSGIVYEVLKLKGGKWVGKNGVTFGDSITWYDGQNFLATHLEAGQKVVGYQSYMRSTLGVTINNQGVSGNTMPEIMTKVKAFNYTGIDFATITSGANDARRNVLPGTVGAIGAAFNTATYAGAMQSSIEYIIAQNKNTKIYLMTPINGWFNESGTANVPGPYNGEMFISRQYVDVVLALGRLYAIPVCNWYDNVFINKLNMSEYLGDNPNYAGGMPYFLHPKQKGFKMMGEQICEFMKMY